MYRITGCDRRPVVVSAAWSEADAEGGPGFSAARSEPMVERPGSVLIEEASEENGSDRIRIRLVGAVDALLAPELDRVVADVTAAQPADVQFDLAEVDFLGSHGMAFLVRVHHAAAAAGRGAGIDAVSRHALIALRIAGLEQHLVVG
jgi:anti-anti-sigma regulatory factor